MKRLFGHKSTNIDRTVGDQNEKAMTTSNMDHLIIKNSWGKETFEVYWKGGGNEEKRPTADCEAAVAEEENEINVRHINKGKTRLTVDYKEQRLQRLSKNVGIVKDKRHVGDVMAAKYNSLAPQSQIAVVCTLNDVMKGTKTEDPENDFELCHLSRTEGGWDIDEELRNVQMDKLIANCPIDVIIDAIDTIGQNVDDNPSTAT